MCDAASDNAALAVRAGGIAQSFLDEGVHENTLEVFMRLLRVKIGEPKLIHTVRGFGYMMREP